MLVAARLCARGGLPYNSHSNYKEVRAMPAEQEAKQTTLSTPTHEPAVEWLTDVIDELKRDAFLRSLERRDTAAP